MDSGAGRVQLPRAWTPLLANLLLVAIFIKASRRARTQLDAVPVPVSCQCLQ